MLLLLTLFFSAFDFYLRNCDDSFCEICQAFHGRVAWNVYFHDRFFLPRRSCSFDCSARLRQVFAGQSTIGDPLAEHGRARFKKAHSVSLLAIIETADLLIEIPEQVKRFA